MVRFALAAAALASLLVNSAQATTCPTLANLANPVAIDNSGQREILSSTFKTKTGSATLTPCVGTERVRIVAVKVKEQSNSVNLGVSVKYRTGAGDSTPVDAITALSSATCYDATSAGLTFDDKAYTNHDKVDAVVTISGAVGTSVAAEVWAECVPICPDMTGSATAITAGSSMTIAQADFKNEFGSGPFLGCSGSERVDIVTVKTVEISGLVKLGVSAAYRRGVGDTTAVPAFTPLSGFTCYAKIEADTSFVTKANTNADKVDAVVTITPANGAAANVKAEVWAKCRPRSTCPVITTAAESLTRAAGVKTIPLTKFMDSTGTPFTTTTCPAGKRVEIVSAQFLETNDYSIEVNVRYQTTATFPGVNPLTVKAYTGASCYSGVEADVSLGAKADSNSDKVNPVVTVQCPTTSTTDCSVKYKIIAKCVDASTTCAAMTGTAEPIAANAKLDVAVARITDANKVALSCSSTQRIDLVSVKVSEVNSANLNVAVKYQNAATPPAVFQINSATGVTCYQSAAATEVSFAKADVNPDKTTPVVTVTCPSTTTACSVKYEVIGKCVEKNAACPVLTLPTTAVTVAMNTDLTLDVTKFVDSTKTAMTVASCTPTQRLEIMSVKVTEQNGAPINVYVDYLKTTAAASALRFKSYTDGVCYSVTDTAFAALADANPEKTDANVVVECPSKATDCKIKYEIVAKCVDKSAACSTIAGAAETITRGGKLQVATSKITDANKVALACTGTQRINLVSAKVTEVNGVNINIDAGYFKNGPANRVSVKTVPGTTCYQSVAGDLSFTALAPANPEKTVANFVIECPSTTSDCSVKYELVGECIAVSTACPALTTAAVTIAKGSKLTIDASKVVDSAKVALACTPTSRVDMLSATIIETNYAPVNVYAGYQKDGPANRLVVRNGMTQSCFQATDLSFAVKADSNPDKTLPVIDVECPLTNAGDCTVKYEVIGKCVTKAVVVTPAPTSPTPAPTTPTTAPTTIAPPKTTAPTTAPTTTAPVPTPTTTKSTELASAASTTMDYYTRAIAMVVSIVAGAAMMYMRH